MDSIAVANMALDAIGARSAIVSMDEQSPEALCINRHYEQTLKELLRAHTWRFARANEALAVWKARIGTPENPSGAAIPLEEPEWPWLYSYRYPADCATCQYIMPSNPLAAATIGGVPLTTADYPATDMGMGPPVRFLESSDMDRTLPALPVRIKVLLTNMTQARLVYTTIITDPDMWDANFVTAFVGRLAGKICIPLSGDKALMKLAMQVGKMAEDEAKVKDANEVPDIKDWQPEAQAAAGFDDPTASGSYLGVVRQEIS